MRDDEQPAIYRHEPAYKVELTSGRKKIELGTVTVNAEFTADVWLTTEQVNQLSEESYTGEGRIRYIDGALVMFIDDEEFEVQDHA